MTDMLNDILFWRAPVGHAKHAQQDIAAWQTRWSNDIASWAPFAMSQSARLRQYQPNLMRPPSQTIDMP